MDSLKCDLCGGNSIKKLFKKDGFTIMRCNDCHLVFTYPQDSEDNLKKRYSSKEYFATRYVEKFGYGNYADGRHLLDPWFKSRQVAIEKLCPQKGKLLDIGCALGFFLDLMKQTGWETVGLDYSDYAVQYAKDNYHLEVYQGRVEDVNFSKNSFDVITLFDVIEHVRSPLTVFTQIHELLKSGGLLHMTTPNCDGLLRKLMRRHWFHFKPLEHTYFFSPQTLTAYFQKTGFEFIQFENCKKIVDLDYLINRTFHYNPHFPRIAQAIIGSPKFKNYPFPFPTGEINIYARKK